jgi:transcriptional regulator with XRE-family HTH domain
MTIGEKIRITRKTAKMTQKDFADITGFSVNTISRYETGERVPSWGSIRQIASAFGVSAAELLNGVDEYAQNAINDFAEADVLHSRLLSAFDRLNDNGKNAAVERVEELAEIEKYTQTGENSPQN